ncbi:MAG: nucleotidyltransferase domain-containing protein [Myxococcota bacterium]
MTAQSVVAVLEALEEAGVRAWLDGGWGVDALLGKQTRPHGDLDLVIDRRSASGLEACLRELGFERANENAYSFVMSHSELGSVDVHGVRFDERGYGAFEVPGGGEWPFPPSAFAGVGTVAGKSVGCLSAEAQVQCHGQGYEPTGDDLQDMAHLQERFGVVLPLALCRRGS